MNSRPRSGKRDFSPLVGIVLAFGLVLLGISSQGSLSTYIDAPSMMIVLGGTIGAAIVNFSVREVLGSVSLLSRTVAPLRQSPEDRVQSIIYYSEKARRLGRLTLEEELIREDDPFLRKGLELIIDGATVEDAKRVLEIELRATDERHRRGAEIFHSMGSLAPAMGLVGTLIGLVQMMKELSDPDSIGPAMAVALLTTFYGALLSYMVLLPLAGKLRIINEEELRLRELTIEGILGIIDERNPRLIEQRLNGFLAPQERGDGMVAV